MGDYGRDTWFALRKTEKTRVYTPNFMASLLELAPSAYQVRTPMPIYIYATNNVQAMRNKFLSAWMLCLVDRESMLKFQHEYTSSLFNADQLNPLLANPPFEMNRQGHYEISLIQFRERRLSLISSMFALK